jgi:integrase
MDMYEALRIRVLSGQTINAKTVSNVIDEFLATQKSKTENRFRDIDQAIGKYLREYARGQKIDWLDSKTLTLYFLWRTNEGSGQRTPGNNTLHSEAGELRRLLRWCKDMKYLEEVPNFTSPIRKDNVRPAFSRQDWRKLTRHARHWIAGKTHPSVLRDRTLLWNYVLILANTGIRVGEARSLRWRDIRTEQNDTNEPTVIFYVSGKTGGREVVARNAEVLDYLQRIKSLYDQPNPDGLVFAHPDGKQIGSFKRSFCSLIDDAGVTFDNNGVRRTIYSLRHTYATFRLTEGVTVYTLARNMGTSVAMIERFYGQTRNPDQFAELTRMRNRTREVGTILDVLDNR